jgi:hypothetical protein
MALNILSITSKNFLSIGNCSQAITLNRNELTLVLGENVDLGGEDSGSRNGTGKCLRGGTNIDITFKNIKTEEKFKLFMQNKKNL